jgi:hypothetical protein
MKIYCKNEPQIDYQLKKESKDLDNSKAQNWFQFKVVKLVLVPIATIFIATVIEY